MTSKKGLISSADLASIMAQYGVFMEVELSAVRHDETYKDQRLRYICINEFMLKVGIKLLFKFGVTEALNTFEVTPIQVSIVRDLLSVVSNGGDPESLRGHSGFITNEGALSRAPRGQRISGGLRKEGGGDHRRADPYKGSARDNLLATP
ncbi:hypothetical protein ACLOJK_013878 [Asimina triloba]